MTFERKYLSSGVANIVVVIFVLFACVGLVAAFVLTGRSLSVTEKIKKREVEAKQIDDEKDQYQDSLIKISPYITDIGQYGAEVDPEKVRKILDAKLKEYELISKVDRFEEIGGEDLTLEFVVGVIGKMIIPAEVEMELSEFGKNTSEQRFRKFQGSYDKIDQIKNDEIAEINMKRNDITAVESKENVRYQSRVDDLTSRRSELDTLKSKKDNEFSEKKKELEYEVRQVKQEIEFLSSRGVINRDIIEVQGKIIKPAVKNWYSFINLGANDNVRLGLKFRVYRKDKHGKRRWKGVVEVKKIFDTYSQVSVNAINNSLDPILEGDYINNVFYSSGKPKYVVLIGDIERGRGGFKYSKAEIKRRLTDIGVVAEDDVSLKTDFAILGSNYDMLDSYNKLKLLNIPYLMGQEARECIEYYLGD